MVEAKLPRVMPPVTRAPSKSLIPLRKARPAPLVSLDDAVVSAAAAAPKAASKTTPKKKKKKKKYIDDIDEAISLATARCEPCGLLQRLSRGKYLLNGKKLFIRVLRSSIVVRVGGGWANLEMYMQSYGVGSPRRQRTASRDSDAMTAAAQTIRNEDAKAVAAEKEVDPLNPTRKLSSRLSIGSTAAGLGSAAKHAPVFLLSRGRNDPELLAPHKTPPSSRRTSSVLGPSWDVKE